VQPGETGFCFLSATGESREPGLAMKLAVTRTGVNRMANLSTFGFDSIENTESSAYTTCKMHCFILDRLSGEENGLTTRDESWLNQQDGVPSGLCAPENPQDRLRCYPLPGLRGRFDSDPFKVQARRSVALPAARKEAKFHVRSAE